MQAFACSFQRPHHIAEAVAIAFCTAVRTSTLPIVPNRPVTSGWRKDGQGRWYVVDASAGQSSNS